MSVFKYEKNNDGIVTITMDMTGPVNAMNQEYHQAMHETMDKLEAEEGLTGVVLASAKKVFFAGGDLNDLLAADPSDAEGFRQNTEAMKADLRRLEKLPVPVAAAINGAALGGGYELCLVCNHRVAWNHKAVQIGLPECSLGLFPGGGGVVRMTNMLGVEKALPFILESKRLVPEKALAAGMIDATVDTLEELVPAAKAWILANKDNQDAASQPWDRKGFRIPGGPINSPKNGQLAMMGPTMLHQKTRGLLPQAIAVMDVAFQASMLDVDTALRIEGREFARIATNPVAKNMITTFFFQLNQINAGASRPKDVEKSPTRKVGILGAGMMGQGIAYSSAMSGIEVVLKDISQEAADKGKAYSEKLLAKRIKRGQMDEAKAGQILSLINATDQDSDLQGCDLIIEAVFENIDLKHKITKSTEQYLADDGFWGSNTSTLPITQLAEASSKPENFIGIHFFSPVDKMPLVEIIVGEKTSDAALAKAFDYVQQIRKTPIVVNDSLGFFTSRTFSTYLDEAANLLVEGIHPARIDNLGRSLGMPVGPLQVQDETSLELSRKAAETWAEMGVQDKWGDGAIARKVVDDMVVKNGRGGRHHGGGFYEYHQDGSKSIWPGLLDLYYDAEADNQDQDIRDRLMFRQVIESLKCLESGVLRSVADGNIGSIFGIGAPPHTGGFIQYVNTYGFAKFIARCEQLTERYGDRFQCPQIVRDHAASGELFA
ncbi:MAG: 3-hydroxyacyl-CoA dehydrogenase [Gammaproteobacteria bacterium]|nr:3-hydroxyacyl-CoA dehydrogenase [Gammaproteobacteria bacterium]